MPMDWTFWANVGQAAGGLTALAALAYLSRELHIQTKTSQAAAFAVARGWLQDETGGHDPRKDRRELLTRLANKPFAEWDDLDRAIADRVCSIYQTVAVLVKNGMINARILQPWEASVANCWNVAVPWVNERRHRSVDSADAYAEFEWFARQCARRLGRRLRKGFLDAAPVDLVIPTNGSIESSPARAQSNATSEKV